MNVSSLSYLFTKSIAVNVPLLDLKEEFREIEADIRAAINNVIEHQTFVLGPEVEALENHVARDVGVRFGIGTSSGTDALLCSLMALGVGPGDEVITTPFTFFGTAGVVARLGAKPVFADIDPDTYNLDPAAAEAAITDKTVALMPVHMAGLPADMDAFRDLASRKGLLLIEDAAPLARVYQEYLRDEPYLVTHVETGEEALATIGERAPERR